jgi:hypothetical protein
VALQLLQDHTYRDATNQVSVGGERIRPGTLIAMSQNRRYGTLFEGDAMARLGERVSVAMSLSARDWERSRKVFGISCRTDSRLGPLIG